MVTILFFRRHVCILKSKSKGRQVKQREVFSEVFPTTSHNFMGVKRLSKKPKPRRTANHCLYFLRNFYNISRLWVCQKTFPEKQTTTLRRKCKSIRPMSAVNAFLYFPRPPAIPVAEKEAGHQNGIIILRITGLEIYLDHKVHDDQDVQDDRVDQQVWTCVATGHSRCQVAAILAPVDLHGNFLDQRCWDAKVN